MPCSTLLNTATVVGPFGQLLTDGGLLPCQAPAFCRVDHGRLLERTDLRETFETAAMAKVRALFEGSGLSLHELGTRMGYAEGVARQSAFQFMKAGDPRISMLRRFAKAMSVGLGELTGGKERSTQ